MKNELCVHCGKSVKIGSGNFVNRVPVLDSYAERKANGFAYPKGAYVCAVCDTNCPCCKGE